jgi:hypothetical protein
MPGRNHQRPGRVVVPPAPRLGFRWLVFRCGPGIVLGLVLWGLFAAAVWAVIAVSQWMCAV